MSILREMLQNIRSRVSKKAVFIPSKKNILETEKRVTEP